MSTMFVARPAHRFFQKEEEEEASMAAPNGCSLQREASRALPISPKATMVSS
eukprot:CAMPEP_0172596760 /NCGR_PEP_ID=MMETSP1068-20121228/16609_1 /TAXON_ID=35684 /ORGANISM="Pseudopedinella elastica, Strain CCMP716" /LENGTH=51 /DNA_ID=CAMNT_0013395947 /DNA_START=191 /DNA_END=343 /DNA_ORIENTATION=-